MLNQSRAWSRHILYTSTERIAQTPSIPALVGERADGGYFQSEGDRRINMEKSKMAERELKLESES
jgi:hypothetical protein